MRAIPTTILLALFLPGCSGSTMTGANNGGGGGGGNGGSVAAAVTIQDYSFTPDSLTVRAGTTITWTNDGPSGHTVVSDSAGLFESDTLAGPAGMDPYGGSGSGASYSRIFADPGTFHYHCVIHPTMKGVIVVQ